MRNERIRGWRQPPPRALRRLPRAARRLLARRKRVARLSPRAIDMAVGPQPLGTRWF